jgi:hypothetical protein
MSEPIRPLIGDWNHLEASIGARGMGKSTHQCYRALQLSREAHGAYVIGHSLGARLPRKLPADLGGDTLPLEYHTTLARLERGIRQRPQKWHILAPPLAGDGHRVDPSGEPATADALLHFAVRLSTGVRRAAWTKQHPLRWWKPNVDYGDTRAVPIIVIIDEGIAIEAASTTKKEQNKWFLEMIYSLRHLHVALLYAIQNSNARSWQILEQSTRIHCFRITHEWALNSLRAAGATMDEMERIKNLPRYQHVELTAIDVKMLEKSSGNRVPGSDETADGHT